MAYVHNFHQSMKIGQLGETRIFEYLESRDDVESVIDVTDQRHFQKIDVDYLVKTTDGKEYKVEVKTDTYKSGNIYYETISSKESDTIGCFNKTEADFLMYYFINWGYLYIFSMPEYQKWFNLNEPQMIKSGYQKQVKNKGYKDKTYTSIGYAYPVSILEELNPSWMSKLKYEV